MTPFTPRLPEKNVNVSKESPIREFFVLISGIIALIVTVYFLMGYAVDLIVPHISPDLEHALAGSLMKRFGEENDRDETAEPLQTLTDSLQKKCVRLPYRFRVSIADTDQINAVAVPGGNILVFKGLLDQVSNENELAFVLFHEMGHFANRDHLRGFGRALVFISIASFLLGPDNSLSGFLQQGLHISEMKFSREQESHADEFALEMLHCAYGHTKGASAFIRLISGKEEKAGMVGKYYLSHPESEERISHIEKFCRDKGFPAEGTLLPLTGKLRPVL